ncbi:MAG: DUF998 domain-containing protein [Saccharolobus sp.]
MDRDVISGYLVLLGVTEFFFLMFISEVLYPNYSIKFNYISDLGVGKTGVLFNSSIILMGILIIIASLLLKKFYSFAVFLVGLGGMFVGIFPETTGFIHEISALIAFLFGGIGAILTSFSTRSPIRYFWIVLGLITLVSLFLYVGRYYAFLGPGGMERMIVYPELIWGYSFGTYLINEK